MTEAEKFCEENEKLKEYINKLEYLIKNYTSFTIYEGAREIEMYMLWKSIKLKIDM